MSEEVFIEQTIIAGERKLSQIMPEGEAVRNAVKWISNECKENKESKISLLICDAAARYNLSPKDEGFLRAFYSMEKASEG